jgi:hypothetical protein
MSTLPDFAATFAAVRDALHEQGLRWDDVARSTEPADRPTAEAAVRALYRIANRPEPSILWVDSPRGLVAASTLISGGATSWLDFWLRNPSWATGAFAPWALDMRAVQLNFGAADRTASLGRQIGAAIDSAARQGPVEPRPDPTLARSLVGEAAWTALDASLGDLAAEVVAAAAAVSMGEWASEQRSENRVLGGLSTGNLADNVALAAAADDLLGIVPPDLHVVLEQLVALARSAGPWLMGKEQAVLSERPLRLRLDDRGRLHSTDGPALVYGDGTEAFAIHGVVVPGQVVTDRGSITVGQIDAEANVEVRRVLIEQFGVERLIREGGASLVHEDGTGRLWRRELRSLGWSNRDEPVVMVEVVNSTPEPDGTQRTYFLRVPPETSTAHEAVAWTFGLGGIEYLPAAES